jgi:hypothetical protein
MLDPGVHAMDALLTTQRLHARAGHPRPPSHHRARPPAPTCLVRQALSSRPFSSAGSTSLTPLAVRWPMMARAASSAAWRTCKGGGGVRAGGGGQLTADPGGAPRAGCGGQHGGRRRGRQGRGLRGAQLLRLWAALPAAWGGAAACRQRGREAGREGRQGRAGREGRQGGRQGREAGRQAGKGGREAGREGRQGGRQGREAGREAGREGRQGRAGREGRAGVLAWAATSPKHCSSMGRMWMT